MRSGHALLVRIAAIALLALGAVAYLFLMAQPSIVAALLAVIGAFVLFAALNGMAVLIIDIGAIRKALERQE